MKREKLMNINLMQVKPRKNNYAIVLPITIVTTRYKCCILISYYDLQKHFGFRQHMKTQM